MTSSLSLSGFCQIYVYTSTHAELNPPSSAIKLAISTDKWRPLVVEVGALGSLTGISKLAASVIGPLADKCVSVFCLSTSTEDYVMVSGGRLGYMCDCEGV